MLTKEQWQDAARFAGKPLTGEYQNGRWPFTRHHYLAQPRPWQPDTDWNDFGPLWVKLERWAFSIVDDCEPTSNELAVLWSKFDTAKIDGTDAEIMQAGLMLAAAIGKTMREEGK